MKSNSRSKIKIALYSLIALPVLGFLLGPFPGMGLGYVITDSLRGHPHSKHGTQPDGMVGLWVSEVPDLYNFDHDAFYLMPDWQVADMPGMSYRVWHFDNDKLYMDLGSRCGNCDVGWITREYDLEYDGPDRMRLTNTKSGVSHDADGWYTRVAITTELKEEMTLLAESEDEVQAFHGRMVLFAMESLETKSQSPKSD